MTLAISTYLLVRAEFDLRQLLGLLLVNITDLRKKSQHEDVMKKTIAYRVDHDGCGLGSWLGLGSPGAGAAAGRHPGLYAKRGSARKERL